MNCKLCDRDKPLVKAHIIPESFYRSIKKKSESLRIMSVHKGVHTKNAPIGVYDQGILCAECEGKFGPYDDYAHKVLLTQTLQRDVMTDDSGAPIGYLIHGIDYKRFKLFFISLLWRAAVSSHEFFNSVKLGPHFKRLDDLLKRSDPGEINDFSVILWEYVFPLEPVMAKPYPVRMNNIYFYAVSLGKYAAFIKVDKRAYPAELCRLEEGNPLAVTYIDFEGTLNEEAFWEAIQNNGRSRKSKRDGV